MKKLILLVFIIFMTNQDVQAERRQITEPAQTINHQLRVHVTRHTTQQVEGHVHCVTHNRNGTTNVRQSNAAGTGANTMQNPNCGTGTGTKERRLTQTSISHWEDPAVPHRRTHI